MFAILASRIYIPRRQILHNHAHLCGCGWLSSLCCCMPAPAGDPSYELCAGGSDVAVDSANLVAYIQAVVDASLGAGIEAQMGAFREGFNEVRGFCVILN